MNADRLWEICTSGSPVVMAIVNATPDSFWDGSRRTTPEMVAEGVREAVAQGAGIIDVGGYSSRPGAAQVSETEETARVCVALEVIRRDFPGVAVSVDTFRSGVARRAMELFGPCIINDISAGQADPGMVPLAAAAGVPFVAMHMRGTPADMASLAVYDDVVAEVESYFAALLRDFAAAGLHRVIIDPGFGFAKDVRHNYELLAALPRLCALGAPLLAGLSRKSMIYTVGECGPADALPGTCALNWQALAGGARILRVHDVAPAVQVVRLFEYYKDLI